jgi:chromosome partitioning protein
MILGAVDEARGNGLRTIAVLNQKGGVGKTTTVVNTAAALAADGARVAVLDLDPQAHLTIHLGLDPETIEAGAYRVLTADANFERELMMVRSNLWVLPANINLVGAETELVSVVGRETILREAIAGSRDKFDYLMIDCAPSLGLLTLNALAAVDEIMIPLQPHFLALQGLGKLLQTVELVSKRINPELKVNWILLCMYDSRASLPSEVKADIEQFLDGARGGNNPWAKAVIVPIHIRRNIKLAEAPSYGKTIFEYEAECNGAKDYKAVADYISGKGVILGEVGEPQEAAQPVADAPSVVGEPPVHKSEDTPLHKPAEQAAPTEGAPERLPPAEPPLRIESIPAPAPERPKPAPVVRTPPERPVIKPWQHEPR